MKVNPKEITKVLSLLSPVLAKNVIVDQADHFVFHKQQIVAFNDQLCIRHPFSCEDVFSVPSSEIYSVFLNMEEEEAEMEVEESNIIISSYQTKAKISILQKGFLIDIVKNLPEIEKWSPIPEELCTALSLCQFSASRDVTQGFLMCVLVDGELVVSSDNLRISIYKMKEKMISEEQILIPATAIPKILQFSIKDYSVASGWIHFKTEENIIISSRLLQEQYPDVSSFFDIQGETILFPKQIKNIISSLYVFSVSSLEINRTISLIFDKEFLVCRAEKEIGWIEKKIPCLSKKEFCILINPVFLSQIFEKTISKVILSEDRILLTSDSFSHLIALST